LDFISTSAAENIYENSIKRTISRELREIREEYTPIEYRENQKIKTQRRLYENKMSTEKGRSKETIIHADKRKLANSPSPRVSKLYSSIDPLKSHKIHFSKLFDHKKVWKSLSSQRLEMHQDEPLERDQREKLIKNYLKKEMRYESTRMHIKRY